jgi:hypothetical protein
MNQTEHLTDNQLTDYFGNSALERKAKHAIGRHLLQCDFCLKRLPQPTVEQFWTALMTDENEDDSQIDQTNLANRLKFIAGILTQPKVFALSAAGLAIVLFFSAFFWLNAVKSSEMEKEIAVNFETTQPVIHQTENEEINLQSATPPIKSDDSSRTASIRTAPADLNLSATKETKTKQNIKIASSNDLSAKEQENLPLGENISLTRGAATSECGNQTAIDLSIEKDEEKILLKWKKIPNAANYHLYVSDDEEILIDEYETTEGTSYALIKPLDPAKTYQWKVMVTLENGNTVIGDSQKFTVNEIQQNRKKFEKNKKSVVRCTAKN